MKIVTARAFVKMAGLVTMSPVNAGVHLELRDFIVRMVVPLVTMETTVIRSALECAPQVTVTGNSETASVYRDISVWRVIYHVPNSHMVSTVNSIAHASRSRRHNVTEQ